MIKFLKGYLKYIKTETQEVKKIHAVFVATFFTSIFVGFYLYFMYGIKPDLNLNNESVYVRGMYVDENIDMQSKDIENKVIDSFLNVINSFQKGFEVLSNDKFYNYSSE